MRTKFRCQQVTSTESETKIAQLYAVTGGRSEENKSFAKYTPAGLLNITIDPGTEAINFFVPGRDYYLDFSLIDR